MRNYLTIDGVDSRTYGVYISGQGTFGSPARAYNMLSVPGRDGDLVGPERRFQNIEVTYPAFIFSNFATNISDFRNFLLSRDGYVKISDSYHSGEYRMGVYRGPFSPEVVRTNNAGSFNIVFNCKPQRFLTSGDMEESSATITNPTKFNSRPLIKVPSQGADYSATIGLGSDTITITDAPAGVVMYIDCEMMDCYGGGGENLNQYVSFSGYDFPVLKPGANGFTSDILGVTVKGRWFIV